MPHQSPSVSDRSTIKHESADSQAEDVLDRARDLMRRSARLGRMDRSSPEYTTERKRLAEIARHLEPVVAGLQLEAFREGKAAVKDGIVARLSELERKLGSDPDYTGPVSHAVKQEVGKILDWVRSYGGEHRP